MKLYISGPMAGLHDKNFAAFERAKNLLEWGGFVVVSPHESAKRHLEIGRLDPHSEDPEDWKTFLRYDLKDLLECDGVAVLEGAWNSKGVGLETHVARQLGMTILAVSDWLKWRRAERIRKSSQGSERTVL